MSYRVVITDRALDDLREIRDFIAVRSAHNAAKFLDRLIASFDKLEISPEGFGRAPEDEYVPYALRQYVVAPYRILYCVEGAQVRILHVRHGARKKAKPDELS